MSTPVQHLLKDLDLTEKEIQVYLSSLRLGEATIQQIAHAAKLPRTTVASILARLQSLGYVVGHRTKGKFVYWIEDPHVLVEHEQSRLDVMQQLAARLHVQYHSADKTPQAFVYDTKEGITNLMVKVVDELQKGDEILVFESPAAEHYQSIVSDELFTVLSKQKVKRGVLTRALVPAVQKSFVRETSLQHNISLRTLPPGLGFEFSLWIFHQSIVLFSGTHTFAVRINHRHMKESMASLFEHFWLIAGSV
ncbi:MAG: helix-turn-helix domain-containing protein [Patescibacteria group bacterium]